MDGGVCAESVATSVLELYAQLDRNGKPEYPRYTVLAGVVASVNDSDYHTVALATGTKCAGESFLSESGVALADSHAEVLARRAFIRYLFQCLSCCLSFPAFEESARCPFRLVPGCTRFCVKEGWKFYIYSSDSPCGDASVYERVSGRSFSGKKARICSATEFSGIIPGAVRLKPGRHDIPDRCRTLSMSCSDKIAKWNFLGIQGALLSHLIEPIFIRGFVVGSDPFGLQGEQEEALRRALLSRVPGDPCSRSRVFLCRASFPQGKCASEEAHNELTLMDNNNSIAKEILQNLQPFELSINWILSVGHSSEMKFARAGGTIEITLSRTGISQGSSLKAKKIANRVAARGDAFKGASRLCNRSLFSLFCDTLRLAGDGIKNEIFKNIEKSNIRLTTGDLDSPSSPLSQKVVVDEEVARDGKQGERPVQAVCSIDDLLDAGHSQTWWKIAATSYNSNKRVFLSADPFNNWTRKHRISAATKYG